MTTTPPKSTCCPECFGCKQTKSTHPRTGIVTTTTERGSGYCKDTNCPCHTQSTELEKIVKTLSNFCRSAEDEFEKKGFELTARMIVEAYAHTKVDEALREERERIADMLRESGDEQGATAVEALNPPTK